MPSEEKRSRRQRKSTESNASIQNKDDTAEKKDGKKAKTSPSVSSTEDSSSAILSSLTVKVEDFLNNSMKQTSSEDKSLTVVNNELQRNFGVVDSTLVKEKNQDKAGTDLEAVHKDRDKTPLKAPEKGDASLKEENVHKMAPNVPSGNERKGADFEGSAPWVPEEATYNAPEKPCLSTKATDSSEISKDSQDMEKDKTTVLSQRGSEKVPVKDLTTKGTKSTDLLGTEKVSPRAPAKEVKEITTRDPKSTDVLGAEKISSRAPLKKGPSVPNSKFSHKRTEWLQLATVRGTKKASAIPSKDITKTSPVNFSKSSVNGPANLSVNNKADKNESEGMACEPMEVDTSTISQKPPSSSEVKLVVATNCVSLSSTNSTDHNGELFAGEGLKTYSKKGSANKRKSISRENSLEDSSTVSKLSKMDNKELSEVDHMKNMIHDSKVELARRLNEKLANSSQPNSKPEEQTLRNLLQNSVTPPQRSKASRKKSTDENKVQSSKKAKCEENNSNDPSTEEVQHKPVTRLEVKVNTTAKIEEDNVVDSVSFVADQVVDEVSINHSPTVKDMPGNQFDVGEASNQRLGSRSKERIREMTHKKKELKAKEEKRRERKKARATESLRTVMDKEPETAESLENVVESVLDEKIPVIYNAEGEFLGHNMVKSL